MEEVANQLHVLCAKAQRSGNFLEAREQCEHLLSLFPQPKNINEVLPNEILLMILRFYILYSTRDRVSFTKPKDGHPSLEKIRYRIVRTVCRLWKDIANRIPIFTSMTLKTNDLDFKAFVRPMVQKFTAFPSIQSITIPLKHMVDGSMFRHVLEVLHKAKNLRELTFTSEPKTYDRRSSHTPGRHGSRLTQSTWKSFPPFLLKQTKGKKNHKPCIDTLRLEGDHFETISFAMSNSLFRVKNTCLTTLSIPKLGTRQRHMSSSMEHRVSRTVNHPFCRDICELSRVNLGWVSTGKKSYTTHFSLKTLPNLKRLEIGSMDLRCTECLLCLPSKLETLVIHSPDCTNVNIPKDIQTILRIKTLVLKHVPEDAFYDVYLRESFSIVRPNSIPTLPFICSIGSGTSAFDTELKRRKREGLLSRYDESPESDAYASFLLSHPAIQDVRWEWDDTCNFKSNCMSRTDYDIFGYHCSTFYVTMIPVPSATKRKKEEEGFTLGGKKKRKESK